MTFPAPHPPQVPVLQSPAETGCRCESLCHASGHLQWLLPALVGLVLTTLLVTPLQMLLLLTHVGAHSTRGVQIPVSPSLLVFHPKVPPIFQLQRQMWALLPTPQTPDLHSMIRMLRTAGWELNAKVVDGAANEDLKMTW